MFSGFMSWSPGQSLSLKAAAKLLQNFQICKYLDKNNRFCLQNKKYLEYTRILRKKSNKFVYVRFYLYLCTLNACSRHLKELWLRKTK